FSSSAQRAWTVQVAPPAARAPAARPSAELPTAGLRPAALPLAASLPALSLSFVPLTTSAVPCRLPRFRPAPAPTCHDPGSTMSEPHPGRASILHRHGVPGALHDPTPVRRMCQTSG